jgi:ABC-type branched-subunit amino acid transport system ATPase component
MMLHVGLGCASIDANVSVPMYLSCLHVVELQLKAGEALTVLAFAGAGKTACLRAFALARPSDK